MVAKQLTVTPTNPSVEMISSVYGLYVRPQVYNVIGATLCEPHASVTALLDACVCKYVCMSACGHIPKF